MGGEVSAFPSSPIHDMSQSTDALAEALALQIVEHGQEFYADGVTDPIVGIIEDTTETLSGSMSGMETGGDLSIVIPRASWTPTQGSVITFGDESYTVDRINAKSPHKYSFMAVQR